MKTRFILLFAIMTSGLLISSCATLTDDIEIEAHSELGVNFNAYKTYAWAESAQINYDPIGQWEQPTLDMDEEVRFVINRELRARNINQVESQPDLLVAFAAGIDTTVLELKDDPESDKKVLTNIPKAALVIALIDTTTGYTVWLGYAEADVQPQQTIENIRTRIDYAVSEILKPYNQ